MSYQITRLAEDQSAYSPDAPASTQIWLITGTEDPFTVRELIDANVPAYDEFLTTINPLGNPFIDATPEHKGAGVWIVTVRFGSLAPLSTGRTRWEWDGTGGREKIYQSKETRYQQASDAWLNTGAGIIDFQGAIGVTETEVQGIEIVVPKLALTAKRRYASSQLVSTYFDRIRKLTGFTNDAAWTIDFHGQTLTFAAGESLFEGPSLSPVTEDDDGASGTVEIAYHFTVSRDRLLSSANAVSFVGFSEPLQKPGWDYAWLSYSASTNGFSRIKPPQQYQSERVYDSTDFSVFLI